MTIHSVSQGGLEDEQAKLTFKAGANFFCFNLKERSTSETLSLHISYIWQIQLVVLVFFFFGDSIFSLSKDMRYRIYMLFISVFLLT